ncbi:MAG: hypothetical protein FWF02_06805 [Micrococcales bacterium]|nr:hypothetical protein [Micrococcales bacterium]MCL2667402.1 hypothetical protein [Micrococcales bacterium]
MSFRDDHDAAGSDLRHELSELRAERDRLRTENTRLARLLELGGQDTSPVAEQLAAPVRHGLVSMASPTQRKLALYLDLFRARTDTYARRWENPSLQRRMPGYRRLRFDRTG